MISKTDLLLEIEKHVNALRSVKYAIENDLTNLDRETIRRTLWNPLLLKAIMKDRPMRELIMYAKDFSIKNYGRLTKKQLLEKINERIKKGLPDSDRDC